MLRARGGPARAGAHLWVQPCGKAVERRRGLGRPLRGPLRGPVAAATFCDVAGQGPEAARELANVGDLRVVAWMGNGEGQ